MQNKPKFRSYFSLESRQTSNDKNVLCVSRELYPDWNVMEFTSHLETARKMLFS